MGLPHFFAVIRRRSVAQQHAGALDAAETLGTGSDSEGKRRKPAVEADDRRESGRRGKPKVKREARPFAESRQRDLPRIDREPRANVLDRRKGVIFDRADAAAVA